jgi:hypothetical protein
MVAVDSWATVGIAISVASQKIPKHMNLRLCRIIVASKIHPEFNIQFA